MSVKSGAWLKITPWWRVQEASSSCPQETAGKQHLSHWQSGDLKTEQAGSRSHFCFVGQARLHGVWDWNPCRLRTFSLYIFNCFSCCCGISGDLQQGSYRVVWLSGWRFGLGCDPHLNLLFSLYIFAGMTYFCWPKPRKEHFSTSGSFILR